MPKLSLYQITDVKSRRAIREIVDGQQRSQAILDYYHGTFRLSRSLELETVRDRSFSELPEEYQGRFLEYSLPADLLVGAVPEQIREMFRRINSYTIPLNAEEQRHAEFQGEFKWFIYRLSRLHENTLLNMGVLTENQVVRMQDNKLLSEISHALIYGISTTSKSSLNALYRAFDKELPLADTLEQRINLAMERLISLVDLHKGPLMRPFIVYSLVLAMIHMDDPVETLTPIYERKGSYKFERDIVLSNLSLLAEALENSDEVLESADESEGSEARAETISDEASEVDTDSEDDLVIEEESRFQDFVRACSSRTNVKDQRETRFRWLCEALLPKSL